MKAAKIPLIAHSRTHTCVAAAAVTFEHRTSERNLGSDKKLDEKDPRFMTPMPQNVLALYIYIDFRQICI